MMQRPLAQFKLSCLPHKAYAGRPPQTGMFRNYLQYQTHSVHVENQTSVKPEPSTKKGLEDKQKDLTSITSLVSLYPAGFGYLKSFHPLDSKKVALASRPPLTTLMAPEYSAPTSKAPSSH